MDQGGALRCIRVYREGGGLGLEVVLVVVGREWRVVIVIEQIPGGKFLTCLRSRISNQRPAAALFLPGLGNPINCV